ncbi:GntR family transcriptional regulator [Chelativorans sp. YIM 93263]|uniref:GntR family transcriptional regulator n=1 Tax=Chelativorans sp. YIM 93263 TaxID=2906648 RepID=UPI0023795A2A|nr:GntR family transcriptional regulator [Chelativorans sp. YIM 93263]
MNFSAVGSLPIRERSLSMQVEDTLAQMLWDGTLQPLDRTSIRDLAEQLGVSTMPVREAVSRLVAQGALSIERNRAIVVPQLSIEDFRDLTDARLLIEGRAVRKATHNLTEDDLAELREMNDEFAKAMSTPSSRDPVKVNQRFHFRIYKAAASPTLARIIAMNWLRAGPMINLDIGLPSRRIRNSHSLAAHIDLIAALEARDEVAAERALQRDIETAAASIIENALSDTSGQEET